MQLDTVVPCDLKLDGKHHDLARSLAELLSDRFTSAERTFYRNHLAHGGDSDRTHGLQQQLAKLLVGLRTNGTEFNATELRAVIKMAGNAETEELATRLKAIRAVESLLVPASSGVCIRPVLSPQDSGRHCKGNPSTLGRRT